MVNKREILQPMLDKIEPDWVIVQPDPLNPYDRLAQCQFQNQKPKDYRGAFVNIPTDLFETKNLDAIERLVAIAIQNAKPKF